MVFVVGLSACYLSDMSMGSYLKQGVDIPRVLWSSAVVIPDVKGGFENPWSMIERRSRDKSLRGTVNPSLNRIETG